MKRPGGWELYKAAMEEAATKMDKITENEGLDIEDVMKQNEAIMTKVKFKAFGKSKPISQKALSRRMEDRIKAAQGLDDEEKIRELRRKQYNDMEEEINKLNECIQDEGDCGRVKEVSTGATRSD